MKPSLLAASIAALVLLWGAAADAGSKPAFSVPFQDDDYAQAMKDAQAKGVPVFVESWAPW